VHQVLADLLDNALKHGPTAQTLIVALSRVAGRAPLTVSHEGSGIPPPDRERIRRPFTRFDRGAAFVVGWGDATA